MSIPVKAVNEDSTAYLDIEFRDANGALVTPISAVYSIWCLTNDESVRAVGDISPVMVSQMTIQLTPDDNALIDAANPYETRKILIEAVYEKDGTVVTGQIIKEFQYDVLRVRKPA